MPTGALSPCLQAAAAPLPLAPLPPRQWAYGWKHAGNGEHICCLAQNIACKTDCHKQSPEGLAVPHGTHGCTSRVCQQIRSVLAEQFYYCAASLPAILSVQGFQIGAGCVDSFSCEMVLPGAVPLITVPTVGTAGLLKGLVWACRQNIQLATFHAI